jgi:cytoskeletal protein CcmA (bactofilin family)
MTKAEAGNAFAMPAGITTLIGAGMQVAGNITCKGTLRIQGTVLGNVHCNGQGDALVVDATGAVTGEVHATNVAARGRIIGPVYSTRAIEVQEGATILGDIAFSRLSIHAGGVVEGLLKPEQTVAAVSEDAATPLPETVESTPPDMPPDSVEYPAAAARGFKAGWLGAAAGVLALAVGLGAWLMPGKEAVSKTPPEARAEVVPAGVSVPPVAEASSPAVKDTDLVLKDAARLAALATPETDPMEPAEPTVAAPGAVVIVKGANPNRPAGVFLLISNDAAYLYRKRQDEPGDGTRINIASGEKTSVAFAPDEVIRIAKGRDVTIYFQGQKVPAKLIESGSWIKFVPVR